MKIYNSINDFSISSNVVLTLGTFDGVHTGHRSILDHLRNVANKVNGETVLLTFYPHPRHVIYPDDQDLKLISTIEERSSILERYGLDHLIIEKFTDNFSRMKSVNFVRDILVNKLNVKDLIIGYDHHFGRNRQGNYQELKDLSSLYQYRLRKIDPKKCNGVSVSSSKIRKLILENNFLVANQYLGYPYMLEGIVVKGNNNGSKIGFPTANVYIENKWKLIPNDGVYAVKVIINNKHYIGMMNIGYNPTFNARIKTLEVHILDFNKDIYGEKIRISFYKRIRDERKFNDINQLKATLNIDQNKVRNIFDY